MARSIVVVADSILPDLLFWLAAEAKAPTAGDKGANVSKGSKGGGGGGGRGGNGRGRSRARRADEHRSGGGPGRGDGVHRG